MHSVWFLLALFQYLQLVTCENLTIDDPTNSTIANAFPGLVGFQRNLSSRLSPSLGGQNFDHCCLQAVNDSLGFDNGTLTLKNASDGSIHFNDDLSDFRNRQFPCGAGFINDRDGAAIVQISYRWCKTNCGGWQISKNDKINEWVSPFVGFLVPAVVFCLAIPRRRKINIPDILFDVPLNAMTSAYRTPFIATAAAFLASLDTLQWLMTIFALSGPILLSGIYEATLDSRILAYVQKNLDFTRLRTAQRAHLLYIVLVGNLDMLSGSGQADGNSAYNDIDGPGGLLSKISDGDMNALDRKFSVDQTKTRLRDMLAAQYSFGVTVGAPVVFFCGSFIYTLIDNLSNLGDNNVSHALAFGMWWMTIPHIAIVSGLLLAGNNPNTLEAVVGKPVELDESLKWGFLRLAYESHYKPAWIWNRGRSKKIWCQRISRDSTSGTVPDGFETIIKMKAGDWTTIFLLAYSLIVIPSVLAFLTSYYTPLVGLSCRSMTFLVYMLCQLWLSIVWIWDIELTSLGEDGQPRSPCTRKSHASSLGIKANWIPLIWYVNVIPASAIAVFSTIGGTMMQIMGVYRNCRCNILIRDWGNPDNVMLDISTNTKTEIDLANRLWTGTGATAITFLGFVTFVGWWYQKRLRYQFKSITNDLGKNTELEMSNGMVRAPSLPKDPIPNGIEQNRVGVAV